ncbi:glycerol acyltransferase (plasmid) [Fulvitalea axinellae]|uniref:Glycerol acyltransferase n=1 Tax=Fulvitalea axinellae TaxID=1182444 RepID=A0AAU9DNF7_9BACT|nr:glycerol acyltransferase [Fulvitalea axinellae]
MRELISQSDFISATNLKFESLAKPLMKVTGLNAVNHLYDNICDFSGVDFLDQLFGNLDIEISVDPHELERIPKTGSFITVSNHPFGAIDGMALIRTIHSVRPDFKAMANFLLQKVGPISDFFIPVNPFEDLQHVRRSTAGIKRAIGHLREGQPLGLFPAGEVSTYTGSPRQIMDREWQASAIRLVQKAKVPVVPVYFQGGNSKLFHILGMLHPSLRTAALPSEMMKKRGSTIKMRIGTPISAEDVAGFGNTKELGEHLRMRTYALGSGIAEPPAPKILIKPLRDAKPPESIIPPTPRKDLIAEIEKLAELKILSKSDYDLYVSPGERIPNVLREISRLREITFREAGEGGNLSCDTDKFDGYYRHLFLWNRKEKEIAGSYRIAHGAEIMETRGVDGFYLSTLFKLREEFHPVLRKCFELGRSFVVKKYQKKNLPLFLIWKGLFQYIERHKDECEHLIGPVSISNQYAAYSKSLIAAFIQKYHFDEELAKHIRPRKAYKFNVNDETLARILNCTQDDLKKLDLYLQNIDPSHFSVPILLKKYIYQNAKIIGFNIDPKFNNCLDGLIILNVDKIPSSTVNKLRDELSQKKDENTR